MATKKIDLFKRRTFGEKLNATFDFVRENVRPLFKYLTYLLLPMSLVTAFFLEGYMRVYMNTVAQTSAGITPDLEEVINVAVQTLLFVFATVLMAIVACSLVYTLMQCYDEREEGLKGITFKDIRPKLMHNIGHSLLIMLGFIVLYLLALAIIVGLAMASPVTLIATVPALLVCILPLAFWMPSYLLEKNSYFGSLVKSVRLGFKTWGGIFGIMFVIGILVNIASFVVSIPFAIIMVAKMLMTTSDEGGGSLWIDYGSYLASTLMIYCSMLLSAVSLIALAYQYGHACDKIDGVSMDRDIDRFDQYADHNTDDPELFDDFDKA